MKQKHNGGYSLIEILIAIAVLGIVTIPATSSLLTAHRVNVQAEKMLTAQLQVSSAVETLMAEGIKVDYNYVTDADNKYPNVDINPTRARDGEEDLPYYHVEIRSKMEGMDDVSVKTYIRAIN